MKNGKKLNRNHKILLKSKGLDPDEWLISKDLSHEGKILIIENIDKKNKKDKTSATKPKTMEILLT